MIFAFHATSVPSQTLRPTLRQNVLVNVLAHVVAPYAVLRTVVWGSTFAWKRTLVAEAVGLGLIDLDAVYPTRHGIARVRGGTRGARNPHNRHSPI